jgi:hypothetical protein
MIDPNPITRTKPKTHNGRENPAKPVTHPVAFPRLSPDTRGTNKQPGAGA